MLIFWVTFENHALKVELFQWVRILNRLKLLATGWHRHFSLGTRRRREVRSDKIHWKLLLCRALLSGLSERARKPILMNGAWLIMVTNVFMIVKKERFRPYRQGRETNGIWQCMDLAAATLYCPNVALGTHLFHLPQLGPIHHCVISFDANGFLSSYPLWNETAENL